jgi:DNA-directed RNA polymerase sigma subunit (sigma70/sigma32)
MKHNRKDEKRVIDRLMRYSSYKIALEEEQKKLSELINEKTQFMASISSPILDKPPVKSQSDPTYAKVQKATVLYDRRITRQEEVVGAFEAWIHEVDNAMLQLTGAERRIIQGRYMSEGRPATYAELAEELNYSESHCKALKNMAICKLARLL